MRRLLLLLLVAALPFQAWARPNLVQLSPGGGGDVEGDVAVHRNDDVPLTFGNTAAAPDAKLIWDTSGTDQLQVWLTDCDGGGTDCVPMYWLTGTSTTVFGGDIDLDTNRIYGDLSADADTYLQRSAADTWTITSGGTASLAVSGSAVTAGVDIDLNTQSKQLVLDAGTCNDPAIAFGDDDDGTGTGIYRTGANQLAICSNGSMGVWLTTAQFQVTSAKELIMNGGYVADQTGMMQMGGNFSSSHGLGVYDIGIKNGLEVDGNTYLDGGVNLPTQIGTGAPTEPVACSAATAGRVEYVDDTDDSAAAEFCACQATTDDGAGTPTMDWINITSGAACSFY